MPEDNNQEEQDISRELRQQQKFSLSAAIGQAGGGDMMKGASPIPRREQASTAITEFIKQNCPDPSGALKAELAGRIKNSGPILEKHLADPLKALVEIVQAILDKEQILFEFVRQVDVRWGQMYQERPHFQQPGQKAHPEDEYSHNSVKEDLTILLQKAKSSL